MLPFNIRQSEVADAEPLGALATVVFGATEGRTIVAAIREHSQHDFMLGRSPEHSTAARYWVAQLPGNEIVGMIGLYQLRWIGSHVAYLGWFFVDPTHQGRGAGRALLDFAKREAIAAGIETLLVETSDYPTSTLEFYLKQGFRFVARVPRYWTSKADLVLMSFDLTNHSLER